MDLISECSLIKESYWSLGFYVTEQDRVYEFKILCASVGT